MAWARPARVPWWPTTVAPAQRANCAARVPPAPNTPVYQHGDTGDRPVGVGQVADLQHFVVAEPVPVEGQKEKCGWFAPSNGPQG
jgi:hypothetical protein